MITGSKEASDCWDMAEYVRNCGKPLVLYGMGKGGLRAYRKIKSLGLKVDALADGDAGKQHTFVDGLEILSPEAAMQKYEDAMVLITVLSKGLAAKIEETLNQYRTRQEIAIYNDILFNDLSLPFVIVGQNRLAGAVRRQLAIDNLDFRGYLLLEGESEADYAGEKVVRPQELGSKQENVNIILCDTNKEKEVIWHLQKYNLAENCFRGYDPSFGFFRRSKYEPAKVVLRELLYPHLCALNKTYYGLADEASRQVFYDVCREFFSGTRVLSVAEYKAVASERQRWLHDLHPVAGTGLPAPGKSVRNFLRFLIALDRLTANYCCRDIKLERRGDEITVTFSEEGAG